jgi:hypothetical protein
MKKATLIVLSIVLASFLGYSQKKPVFKGIFDLKRGLK